MKTHKEYITTQNDLEIWGSKYSWESWFTKEPLIDIRTNKIYNINDYVFALMSYIDENGKLIIVNELQYFKPYTAEKE